MLAGLLLAALLLPQHLSRAPGSPRQKCCCKGVYGGDSYISNKWLHARIGIEQLKLYPSRCIAGLGMGLHQPCQQSGAVRTAQGVESINSHC